MSPTLDVAKAADGRKSVRVKCSSCHKSPTSEKLVGPGWLGVTSGFTAEWDHEFYDQYGMLLDKILRAG